MIYLYLVLGGLAGAFIQSGTGFGSAIVMMNIFPLLLPADQSIIICQLTCLVMSSAILFRCYRHIQWRICVPLLIPALILTGVSSFLAGGMESSTLKTLLGFVFIGLSIFFSFIAPNIHFRPTPILSVITGSLSGIANGLFSMGGPPAILYLAPALDDKTEYLATTQFFFLATNLMSISVRLASGQATTSAFLYALVSSFGAIIGTILGCKAVSRINSTVLKRIIYIFIGINGLVIVSQRLF